MQDAPAIANEEPSPAAGAVRAVATIVGTLLVLNFLLTFVFATYYIQTNRDMTFPEGSVVGGAVAAAQGQPVYADWRQWPHRFAPYGPALYYPVGWIARAAGALEWPLYDLRYYLIGRWISVLSWVGIGLVAALMLRRAGLRWGVAAACGLGALPLWPGLVGYVISYRPDAPLVLWNMAAVCAALHGLQRPRMRWLTFVCLWMALAYKSTGLAAPLVVAGLAVRDLGWRRALPWGAVYVAGVLGLIFGMQAITGGTYILNTLVSQINGVEFPSFLNVWLHTGFHDYWDVMLRLLLVVPFGLTFWLRRTAGREARALGAYATLSMLLYSAQTAKVGSDINYMMEPWALGGVLAGLGWRTWGLGGSQPRCAGARVALAALASLALVWPLWLSLRGNLNQIPAWKTLGQHVYPETLMSREEGPLLLMDSALTHPDPEAHAIPDPIIYYLMIDDGRLSPLPLVERLERRQYRLIAFGATAHQNLFNRMRDPRIIAALKRNYRQVSEDWRLQTWAPLADPPAASPPPVATP